ncbi:MAG: SigE family RNA polymerase sigma factor, partial [Stackebrandtia sp.]
ELMRTLVKADYRDYVAARMDAMRRFAFLNCGNWHRAEEATAQAFVKLYVAWPRARRHNLDAYTRRIIVNTLIDESRRPWFRRERAHDTVPETAASDTDPAERLTILAALARLPARCRATVILRFWEDLSVADTAAILRCSPNTVKTQTARGLRTLRGLLAESIVESPERANS